MNSTAGATTTPDGTSVLRWGPDGLIPAVVQDHVSGNVLMVGFMNEAALAATRATGRTHFWSRSRGKLWRKGETSGHEQVVEGIFVNCEANSLLLKVRQLGAVCHDGYATCYYRRLDDDGTLAVVGERAFDPIAVYGPGGDEVTRQDPNHAADPLAHSTRVLYGALAFLRDHDLSTVSRTSARLRRGADTVGPRIVDELRELAGALDGSHRHTGTREDVLLEGTQVVYWVLLFALRADLSWDRLRPDRALATGDEALDRETVVPLLRSDARRWQLSIAPGEDHVARCHETLALVGNACGVVGLTGQDLVTAEFAEMRTRDYLVPYFECLSRDTTGSDRS